MNIEVLMIIFATITTQNHLPEGLLSSICFVESSYRPAAINKDDGNSPSVGLCQIKYETAKMLGFSGKSKDLLDPTVNAFYAGRYLKKQLSRYKNNAVKAVAAYNSGTYREAMYGGPLNNKYVDKVFKRWKAKK